MDTNIIHTGDCLQVSEKIPSGSVDLILTDPPYGTMKGVDSIDGWDSEEVDWDTAIPPETLIQISERILRKGGRAVFFAQEPYTSNLVSNATATLPFSYRMVWEKDVHGNTLLSNVAPVNMFEDIVVFTKSYDSEGNHPLRTYFKSVLEYTGDTKSGVIDRVGQCADHCFRFDSTQFEICTQETYKKLIEEYSINNMDGFKQYSEIKTIAERYKERYKPVFNLPDGKSVKKNVLKYNKPHEGKHPTQKPVPLLADLIKTFTNSGDLVVDLTTGSGSTCVACRQQNRQYIGIEKDEEYAEIARVRTGENPQDPTVLRSDSNQTGLEAYEVTQ